MPHLETAADELGATDRLPHNESTQDRLSPHLLKEETRLIRQISPGEFLSTCAGQTTADREGGEMLTASNRSPHI